MITLPKLRDALREMQYEVRVPEEIAVRARVPIDRMVAIGCGAGPRGARSRRETTLPRARPAGRGRRSLGPRARTG